MESQYSNYFNSLETVNQVKKWYILILLKVKVIENKSKNKNIHTPIADLHHLACYHARRTKKAETPLTGVPALIGDQSAQKSISQSQQYLYTKLTHIVFETPIKLITHIISYW